MKKIHIPAAAHQAGGMSQEDGETFRGTTEFGMIQEGASHRKPIAKQWALVYGSIKQT